MQGLKTSSNLPFDVPLQLATTENYNHQLEREQIAHLGKDFQTNEFKTKNKNEDVGALLSAYRETLVDQDHSSFAAQ